MRGKLRDEYELVLGLDWVARHERLTFLREDSFRTYWALLDRLSPDQALEGRNTGWRVMPCDIISLKNTPKVKKTKVKRSVQWTLCKAFGFRCVACRSGLH